MLAIQPASKENDTAHGERSDWPAVRHNQNQKEGRTLLPTDSQHGAGIKRIPSHLNDPRTQYIPTQAKPRDTFCGRISAQSCNRSTLGTVFAKTHTLARRFRPRDAPSSIRQPDLWCLFPSHTPKRVDRRPYSVGPSRIPQVHYR